MQDQKTNSPAAPDPVTAATNAVSQAAQGDFIKKVVEKIKNSENILIALSRDPSVDELAAAIGLTIFLDSIQKHTTAIYSGRTPDSLAFLQPSETFEDNTDSLQDFIISLDKSKADHLRYKLEGDFVKVFITPYKSNITEDDLTFSHGDYNVDFVIALNVTSAGNLDRALTESSRVTRDAAVVNITTGDPGRFGEIEWSNPTASSVSEMITDLIFAIQESDEKPLEHDVATSLLAGIVAATDRFSNNRTNPDTLGIASKLMSMGADQQLITSNISGNDIIHNDDDYSYGPKPTKEVEDRSNLEIDHDATKPNSVSNAPDSNNINPAAQFAPDLDTDSNPTPDGSAITNTNAVTPESVIVQPIIPGVNNPTNDNATQPTSQSLADPSKMQIPSAPAQPTAPTQPAASPAQSNTPATPAENNTPIPNPSQMQIPTPPAPSEQPLSNPAQMQIPTQTTSTTPAAQTAPDVPTQDASRPIMNEAPTPPATKQVGQSLTPPVPTRKEPKNYAEMMEAALAEDTPQPAPEPANAAQPVNTPQSATTPMMEPVANPTATTILPPPPTPNADTASMMPPVLPPVQVPPQMTQ